MHPIKKILVPTDFSDCADHAVEYAVELARQLGAQITLLHVAEVPVYTYSAAACLSSDFSKTIEAMARRKLDDVVAVLRQRAPDAGGVLESGPPGDAIRAAIKELRPDLIVMGTHGRRGLMHAMLGSVAEKTLRLADVPVLVVQARAAP